MLHRSCCLFCLHFRHYRGSEVNPFRSKRFLSAQYYVREVLNN
uniref:Uncharacterized protein n=1 Tax=Arundo donax TaxID=35708 RepID=A0A0A9GMQ2_ARUDO